MLFIFPNDMHDMWYAWYVKCVFSWIRLTLSERFFVNYCLIYWFSWLSLLKKLTLFLFWLTLFPDMLTLRWFSWLFHLKQLTPYWFGWLLPGPQAFLFPLFLVYLRGDFHANAGMRTLLVVELYEASNTFFRVLVVLEAVLTIDDLSFEYSVYTLCNGVVRRLVVLCHRDSDTILP